MKTFENVVIGALVAVGLAAMHAWYVGTWTAQAGVYIPQPEHRELHSVVIFKGAEKKGDAVTLDIEALQDGDFIQYIGVISTDCDDTKDPPGKPKMVCLQVGHEENSLFTQTVKCAVVGGVKVCRIEQLSPLDLSGTVFLAGILKR